MSLLFVFTYLSLCLFLSPSLSSSLSTCIWSLFALLTGEVKLMYQRYLLAAERATLVSWCSLPLSLPIACCVSLQTINTYFVRVSDVKIVPSMVWFFEERCAFAFQSDETYNRFLMFFESLLFTKAAFI